MSILLYTKHIYLHFQKHVKIIVSMCNQSEMYAEKRERKGVIAGIAIIFLLYLS